MKKEEHRRKREKTLALSFLTGIDNALKIS